METLRLENDDPRIIYGPVSLQWSTRELTSVDGESVTVRSTPTDTRFSRILLLFRGTGLKFYAGGSGNVFLGFDDEAIRSVDTPSLPGSPPLVDVTGLEDTDHQLFVLSSGEIWVDHFELESSTGQGFDPIDAGVNATSVPPQAATIEDTSSDIILEPLANWGYDKDEIYNGNSLLRTNITGSTLTYTFDGIAIWVFANYDAGHGSRSITIDDGPSEEVSTRSEGGHLMQRLIWQKTDLSPGEHTIRFEVTGNPEGWVALDFFRILRSEDSDSLSSTTSQGSLTAGISSGASDEETGNPSLPEAVSSVNVKGIAIGVSIGVLALLGLIAFFLWRLLRKRKAATSQMITHVTPHQIYAPPPGPPPRDPVTPTQYHAERPSFEGPGEALTLSSGVVNTTQSPVSASFITSSGSFTSNPSNNHVTIPPPSYNLYSPELPRRKPRHPT